jgi:hypothetical protein
MVADPIAFWCVLYQSRLHLLFPHRDWRPPLQEDEDTNQNCRAHRLLMCTIPSYNDPAHNTALDGSRNAPCFSPLHLHVYFVKEGATCGQRAISHQFLFLPYESSLCCTELCNSFTTRNQANSSVIS